MQPTLFKICTKCNQEKPVSEFYKDRHSKDELQYRCKKCSNAQSNVTSKSYYRSHKEQRSAYHKGFYLKHKKEIRERQNKFRNSHRELVTDRELKRRFGITLCEYKERLAAQGNVCAICNSPRNGMALSVDHDHKTGKVRGILCSACNTVLGHARDNINILEKAIAYLRVHQSNESH